MYSNTKNLSKAVLTAAFGLFLVACNNSSSGGGGTTTGPPPVVINPEGANVETFSLGSPTATAPFNVVITFDAAVSNLTAAGITAENLTINSVTAIEPTEESPTEEPATEWTMWTVNVTPTFAERNGERITLSLMINANAAMNANGGNNASDREAVDFTAPDTTGASITIADFGSVTTTMFEVMVTFSDAISDVLPVHFTPTNLTVNSVTAVGTEPATVWMANVTASSTLITASNGGTETLSLMILADAIMDSDGNNNANLASTGGSGSYDVPDTTGPIATFQFLDSSTATEITSHSGSFLTAEIFVSFDEAITLNSLVPTLMGEATISGSPTVANDGTGRIRFVFFNGTGGESDNETATVIRFPANFVTGVSSTLGNEEFTATLFYCATGMTYDTTNMTCN